MELQSNNNQKYLAPTSRHTQKKQEDDLLEEFDNNFADLQKLFDSNSEHTVTKERGSVKSNPKTQRSTNKKLSPDLKNTQVKPYSDNEAPYQKAAKQKSEQKVGEVDLDMQRYSLIATQTEKPSPQRFVQMSQVVVSPLRVKGKGIDIAPIAPFEQRFSQQFGITHINPTFMQKRNTTTSFNGFNTSFMNGRMPSQMHIDNIPYQDNIYMAQNSGAVGSFNHQESFASNMSIMLPGAQFAKTPLLRNQQLEGMHSSSIRNSFSPQLSTRMRPMGQAGQFAIKSMVSNTFSPSVGGGHSPYGSQFNLNQFMNAQGSKLSDSQSDNENFKRRIHLEEAQSKNIKNFQSLLKDKKRERRNNKKQRLSQDNSKVIKRSKIIHMSSSFKQSEKSMGSENESEEDGDDYFTKFERDIERSALTLFPDSTFKVIWDCTSVLFIFYTSIVVPLQLSFLKPTLYNNEHSNFYYYDTVVVIWFLIDLVIHFNSGYIFKGMLIMERKKIVLHYLKTWLLIDIVCAFPYEWLINPNQVARWNFQEERTERKLLFLQYIKIVRLIRIFKVETLLVHFMDQIVSDITSALTRFSKRILTTLIVAHWNACLIYAVAVIQIANNQPITWMNVAEVTDAKISEIYVNALYWSVTTMATVGYGDIHSVTTYERIIIIFVMLLSAALYAYIINEVGYIVSRYNLLAASYKEKISYVNQFLSSKGIPSDLKNKINRYLAYNWELKKTIKIEEEEVMSLLNHELRNKITVYLNGTILQSIDSFKSFPIDFLSEITFIFAKKSFTMDDNIIFENEEGDEMYFIVNGQVSIIHKKTVTYINDLFKDQYFGEISFFGNIPRSVSCKSQDFTDLLAIKKDMFLDIAVNYPEALGMYYQINGSLALGQKDYSLLKIKCYLCKKMTHISIECPNFSSIAGNLSQHEKKVKEEKSTSIYKSILRSANQSMKKKNKEEEMEQECSPLPRYFHKNLMAPRQSFSALKSEAEQRDHLIKMIQDQTNINNNLSQYEESFYQLNPLVKDKSISQYDQERAQYENEGLPFDSDYGNDEIYLQNDNLHMGGKSYILEDIEENSQYEDSEEGSSLNNNKPKELTTLKTVANFSQKSQQKITINRSSTMNIAKSPLLKNQLGHEDKLIGHLVANLKIQKIDENTESSQFRTDIEFKEEHKAVSRVQSQGFRQEGPIFNKPKLNIKPLKGIRKNALAKRMRKNQQKMFLEDSLDNSSISTYQNFESQTPKRINRNNVVGIQFQGGSGAFGYPAGFGIHTIISSKESLDFTSLIKNNNRSSHLFKQLSHKMSLKNQGSKRPSNKNTEVQIHYGSLRQLINTPSVSPNIHKQTTYFNKAQESIANQMNSNITSTAELQPEILSQTKQRDSTMQQSPVPRTAVDSSRGTPTQQFIKIGNFNWATNQGLAKTQKKLQNKSSTQSLTIGTTSKN